MHLYYVQMLNITAIVIFFCSVLEHSDAWEGPKDTSEQVHPFVDSFVLILVIIEHVN